VKQKVNITRAGALSAPQGQTRVRSAHCALINSNSNLAGANRIWRQLFHCSSYANNCL